MLKLQSGPVALYGQLADIFRDKIQSGVWPDGYEIPTLGQLTEEYSIARVTIRQAIQVLVNEGLLSSHRGRRTQVVYSRTELDPSPLFRSIDLNDAPSEDYGVRVLSVDDVIGKDAPSAFCGQFVGDYVLLRKIDYVDGEPYGTSQNYIRKSIYDRFPRNAPSTIKIARLVREYGKNEFTRCLERVFVRTAEADIARALEVLIGSPIAIAHRVFLDRQDEIVYFGHHFYSGQKFGIERDITASILA